MDLYIRSQNKRRLEKIDKLFADSDDYYEEPEKECSIYNNNNLMGIYKNGKRAIEVLDNIHNLLLLKDMFIYNKEELYKSWENFSKQEVEILRKEIVVYQMPEE